MLPTTPRIRKSRCMHANTHEHSWRARRWQAASTTTRNFTTGWSRCDKTASQRGRNGLKIKRSKRPEFSAGRAAPPCGGPAVEAAAGPRSGRCQSASGGPKPSGPTLCGPAPAQSRRRGPDAAPEAQCRAKIWGRLCRPS